MREKATAPGMFDRHRTRAPLRRKRTCRRQGGAGGELALFIPIKRDDDVVGDVHRAAPISLAYPGHAAATLPMCNLYSQPKGQEAIRSLARRP